MISLISYNVINSFILPLGVLVLIFLDYRKHIGGDKHQRYIAATMFISTFISILMECVVNLFEGARWTFVHPTIYSAKTIFFIFQFVSASYTMLFLDVIVNRRNSRTKAWRKILTIIALFNIVLYISNIWVGFFFYFTDDNMYHDGNLVLLRLFISYLPIILLFFDLIASYKKVNSNQLAIFTVVILLSGVGTISDFLNEESMILWPCVSVSMLFIYLFILRTDYRLDGLTRVENRRSLDGYLRRIYREKRNKPYGFIMIDLDRFKQINDKFGHSVGDEALRDVANVLRATTQNSDFLARYGGDEFVIISWNCSDIQKLTDNIRRNIAKFNAKRIRPYTLELSIGGDIYDTDSTIRPWDFLKKVDHFMFQNKNKRKQQ